MRPRRQNRYAIYSVLTLVPLTVLAMAASSGQTATAAFPGAAGKIAFTRVFHPYRTQVVIANPNGGDQEHPFRTHLKNPSDPKWSANGRRLLFEARGFLWTANPNGTGLTRIGGHVSVASRVSWSANGKRLFFLGRRGNGIYTMTSSGKHLHRLHRGEQEGPPALSPNGKQLVFTGPSGSILPCFPISGNMYGFGLYVMSSNGGSARRIAENLGEPGAVDWSPDGRRIIYSGLRPDPNDPNGTCLDGLYRVASNGSDQTLVFEPHGPVSPSNPIAARPINPVFSPDGRRIVFTGEFFDRRYPGNYGVEVFFIEANGTGLQWLRNPLNRAGIPGDNVGDWQPLRR